jgi:hypothetical protein
MSKAKTAATAKVGKRKFLFDGKEIKPVKFISMSRNFMSAQFEDGELVMDARGEPMAWAKINKQVSL